MHLHHSIQMNKKTTLFLQFHHGLNLIFLDNLMAQDKKKIYFLFSNVFVKFWKSIHIVLELFYSIGNPPIEEKNVIQNKHLTSGALGLCPTFNCFAGMKAAVCLVHAALLPVPSYVLLPNDYISRALTVLFCAHTHVSVCVYISTTCHYLSSGGFLRGRRLFATHESTAAVLE